ncbi:hypothetical protein PENSPDRAFT_685979 [Peniophora sp. CONT]|nr:hypothetical protein PENSPDRAFT_685979 [Peniophora sp. CONT]
MSARTFRVELPTHNHSFVVEIAPESCVHDLKAEIERVCPGQPRVDAQRIIWRGRLLADHEKVADIRTDGNEPTTVHLNVRPNGWASQPPGMSPSVDTRVNNAASMIHTPATGPSTPTYAQSGMSFTRPRFAPTTSSSQLRSGVLGSPQASQQQHDLLEASRLLSSSLANAGGWPHPVHQANHLPQYTPYTTPALPPVATSTPAPLSPSLLPNSVPEQPLLPPYHPLMSVPSPRAVTVTYIISMHELALHALLTGKLDYSILVTNDMRQVALQRLAALGWSWPELFDTPFPPESSDPITLKYEHTVINGAQYLKLAQAGTPTPVQAHALKVLEQTFPLLYLPANAPPAPFQPLPTPTQPIGAPPANLQVLNERLRELNLPDVRVEREVIFEIQLRPLLMPLTLLVLRAAIILWLFAPAGKPIVTMAVVAWFIYETYTMLRAAFVRLNPPQRHRGNNQPAAQAQAPQAAQAPAAPGQPQAQPQAQGQPDGPAAANVNGNGNGNGGNAVGVTRHPNVQVREDLPYSQMALESMAQLNLADEEAALNAQTRAAPPLGRRIYAFFALLLFTAYPAYWDRRRQHLRQREGRIRTELRARRGLEEELTAREDTEESADIARRANEARARARAEVNAAHERRAPWVKAYVERVARDEWVDE